MTLCSRPGKALGELPLQGLVEQQSGLGGVVVSEHDERPVAPGIAQARDHVDRGPAAAQRPPHDPRPVLGLVEHAGDRRRREQRPGRYAGSRAPARRRRSQALPSRRAWAGTRPSSAPPRARPPRRPPLRSRAAIHSAASRSPGEHGVLSIGANCSHTSRSVSSTVVIGLPRGGRVARPVSNRFSEPRATRAA